MKLCWPHRGMWRITNREEGKGLGSIQLMQPSWTWKRGRERGVCGWGEDEEEIGLVSYFYLAVWECGICRCSCFYPLHIWLTCGFCFQLPPQQLENALNRTAALKAPLVAHASQPNIKSSLPRFKKIWPFFHFDFMKKFLDFLILFWHMTREFSFQVYSSGSGNSSRSTGFKSGTNKSNSNWRC